MKTYLGIDLHQKFSYWTLLNEERKTLFQGKVPTEEKETISTLSALPVPKAEIQAVIEPVTQWGWYAEILEREGVQVKLANVAKTKLIASSRLKNDKVDSVALAELLRSNFLPEAYLAPREVRELREFLRSRIFFVRVRTNVKNRIHAILWKHGLSSPCTDLFGRKGLAWLKEQTLQPVFEREMESLLRTLEFLNKEINRVNWQIEKRARLDAEASLLMSMPGVGAFSALMIQAEVGDFSRFPSAQKLASYTGLVSRSRSSGNHLRFGEITRQGSPLLRSVLVEAACQVKPHWGDLHTFFQRIKEKKGIKTARVALARKMITILWWMVKRKEPFRALCQTGVSGGVKR